MVQVLQNKYTSNRVGCCPALGEVATGSHTEFPVTTVSKREGAFLESHDAVAFAAAVLPTAAALLDLARIHFEGTTLGESRLSL